jgi:hypothetical protein
MRQDNKRFFVIVVVIVILWCLCYFLVWLPNITGISVARKKTNHLTQEIAVLSSANTSLAEESIAEMELQHKQSALKLAELMPQVHYNIEPPKNSSLTYFRSHLNQKVLDLRNKANRLGIALDESLGFPATIAANNFYEGYWLSLELVSQVVSLLLELSGEERTIQEISKIGHPSLGKNSSAAFVRETPLEFTIQAKLAVIMKVVAKVSQPRVKKNGEEGAGLFLQLNQLVLETTPGVTDGTVQAKFTLNALQIYPQGQISVTPDSVPAAKSPEQTTPIWERY